MSMSGTGGRICPACGVTALSRYNPDPLCAACARASRDSVGLAPRWVWDSGPMRQALARLDLPAFIAIFRTTSGFSQLDMGSLAGGWSQSMVCRAERGERDTLYDIRKLLAFADAVGMPRTALAPLILGQPDATLDSENDAILDSDADVALREVDAVNVNRRGFTTMATGFATSAVLPAPARVDAAHVRYLRTVLARLRSKDRTVGGGALLPEALRHFAHARRMLDESDYSAAVGQELLVVTTDLGIKTGWLAYDANQQALTRQLYGEAALLADSAGDNAQRTHLYANLVQQSTYMARHTGGKHFAREALRFADRAADAARYEPSPALHSLISLRRALAHAQLGDDVAFRSAITAARRELDRGPHEADSWRTQFVRHSEITGYEAMGKTRLGAPAPAIQLYQAVLDDTTRSPRDRAYYRALLAGTLTKMGDINQAVSHGLLILPDLGTTLTSIRVLRELRPVREAARSAAAAEFRERFDAAARALRAV